jgi:hypothetical protein
MWWRMSRDQVDAARARYAALEERDQPADSLGA